MSSMPTAAYDPRLLPEQETPLVIGNTWLLDQEIPAGGFVGIQDSSQVWEERVGKTRIIMTEGLTTCMNQGRRWTITSGGWNFLKNQEGSTGEGHELALITIVASAVIGLIKSAPDTGLRATPMIPPRNSLAVGGVATCTVVSPQ